MNLPNSFRVPCAVTAASIAALLFAAVPVRAASAGLTLSNIVSFPAGQASVAGLVQGSNGNFYGTTLPVGTNGHGSVFMLTSSGVFTNLVSFNGGDGSNPDAPLLQAKDGNFYGTTSAGGASNYGVIFSISPTGAFMSRTNFNGANGAYPVGGLVQATNQIFYGATASGGAYGYGAVFSYSVTNGLTLLYSFTGTNDGAYPRTGVLVGVNGNLYGTTYQGGTNGLGTVFELTTGGALSTLATLSFSNGAFPVGLVQSTNGTLYAAAFGGGSNGFGTIFAITPRSDTVNVLATFDIANGSNPDAPLLLASDGLLYGTAIQGGADGDGVVFQLATTLSRFGSSSQDTNSALSAEDSFRGVNGAWPEGGLLQARDGNFYGTTSSGGANGTGTIFEVLGFAPAILVQPTNQALVLKGAADFSVAAGGSQPLAYQWQFNGANLRDSGNISGAATNLLVIKPEVLTNSGSYTVIVSNAYGTATSAVVRLTVPAPTLTLTPFPASTTNGTLTVHGTAAGKYGVTNVLYQLLYQTNSGTNWTALAGAGWANDPASTNWSATVSLQGGTNVFRAFSVDPLGNPSSTNSGTIFYLTHSPLTLDIAGFGSVNTNVTGTNLVVGRRYSLQATPAKNNLFSNWTGALVSASNPLSFLMVSNMLLTANFVTNPFIQPNVPGPFNGLFSVSNAVSPDTSGLLKNLKVAPLGTYTASLYLGGSNYAVNGAFDVAGRASNQIARVSALGNLSLVMNINWSTNPPQVTGAVSGKNGGPWTASLFAELAGARLGSAAYTMLIPPGTNAAVPSPVGDGYATITNFAGAVSIMGALADGASFSENIAESATGNLAVFATPYSNKGLLFGSLTLTNGSPEGELTWINPGASGSLFPNGYTNIVAVQSSPWTNPPPGAAAIPLPDGQLIFENVFPTLPLVFAVRLATNNTLEKLVGGPTNTLTGSVKSTTGLLTVRLADVIGTESITATGVVLQNQTNAGGFFTTKTNAGYLLLRPAP